MGATFDSYRLKATTEQDARAEVLKLQRDLRAQYGTDPYNGTISNCDLRGVKPGTFESFNAAYEAMMDDHKRDCWIARYKDGAAICWMVGGWAPE